MIDGNYVLNPLVDEMADSALDLIVAGTGDAVMMVESEANELSEEQMLGAVMFGHQQFQPVIDAIIRLAEKAANEPWPVAADDGPGEYDAKVRQAGEAGLREAFAIAAKQDRTTKVSEVKKQVMAACLPADDDGPAKSAIEGAFKSLEKDVVRGNVLNTKIRIDGRGLGDVRSIVCEVGVLPRTHGSALFTRGETQALVVSTLGTGEDEQFVDALEGTRKERFLLHYNFPPYSVGEVRRMGGPGRREIGHGKLAWRALKPLLPDHEEFPYTLRVVSEVTESNGSSSMATVCGASLSLMDAGVPLKQPVAGIAMGLIKEADRYAVLSDILGDEDHLGDMDFKVAGTAQGITSLQMDIKITGINEPIMKEALAQARDGRLHILGEMSKALQAARGEVGEYAPRIETITIPTDKIREVIGTGGSVIRSIVEESGAKIDIQDDGTIKVAAPQRDSIEKALSLIKAITSDPEVGIVYKGKVVKIVDFGAFVNFFGPKDGLVHISQLNDGRPQTVGEVVKEGQEVFVKLLAIDDRGKVRLSMKVVNQETGEEIPQAPREDGGSDDGDGGGERRESRGRGGRGGRGGGGRDRGSERQPD